jgi:hypothetical protein
MKRFATLVLAAAILTILAAGPATAGQRTHDGLWQVTIQNLTPPGPGGPGSRPLSPPLFVVHAGRADVWSVGTIASHGVAAIAEDANNAPLASALPQLPASARCSPAPVALSPPASPAPSWSARRARSTG